MATSTLNSYIIRQILGPFSLGLTILLTVLSLERLLRLIKAVNEQNAPGYTVFECLFYLLPHYLGLAIPASLFLAILLAVRRLQETSELVIIQSTGISLRALYQPVAMIVIPVMLLSLLLTGYVQPHARYAYRATLYGVAVDNPLASLRPGIFFEMGEGSVLRVDSIQKQDGILEGVFISHQKENSPEQLIIGAQRAQLIYENDTQAPILRLEKGNIVRDNKKKNKISELNFESYPFRLPSLIGEPYGRRGQDEREMVFGELIKGGVHGIIPDSTKAQMRAELHVRIIQPLSLLFFALWAVPLALIGAGRTGKAYGIFFGAGLFVFYEKLIGLGEAYAAQGDLSIWFVLWGPFLILGFSGCYFMHTQISRKLKVPRVKL